DGETNQYQDGAPHLENLRPNEERSIRRAPRTEGKARRIRARRIDLCWTEPLLRRRPVGDSIRSVGGSWPGGCQPSLPRARAIAPPRCLPPTAHRFSSTSDSVAVCLLMLPVTCPSSTRKRAIPTACLPGRSPDASSGCIVTCVQHSPSRPRQILVFC